MSRPRRVLLFTRPGLGGAARHVEQLVRHLDPARVALTVAASPLEDASYPARLREMGIPVVDLPLDRGLAPGRDLRAGFELWRLLTATGGGFDVVHAHTSKPGALARLVGPLAGRPPVVYTPHGFYFTYGHSPARARFYHALETLLGRLGAVVIALSRGEADMARRLAPGRVVLLPNAVEEMSVATPEERRAVRASMGWPAECFMVTMVGRLAEPKEPRVVVEAVAQLIRTGRDVRLLVVGDGPQLDELAAQAEREVPGDRVRLAGARSDAARLQAASDVAVLSSRSEGLPYVLLEASATGVPIVASDLPGCRDVVVDGETGFLTRPGDAGPLGDALARLCDDTALRRSLGEAGRRRIQARHRISDWVERVTRIYEGRRP